MASKLTKKIDGCSKHIYLIFFIEGEQKILKSFKIENYLSYYRNLPGFVKEMRLSRTIQMIILYLYTFLQKTLSVLSTQQN